MCACARVCACVRTCVSVHVCMHIHTCLCGSTGGASLKIGMAVALNSHTGFIESSGFISWLLYNLTHSSSSFL